jgi:hypothetical protein
LCGEAFLEDENQDDTCCYHEGWSTNPQLILAQLNRWTNHRTSGELEYDWESSTWNDWDEKTFGPHDAEENKREHPGGFIWDCCDEPGDDKKGCTVTPHEAPIPIYKRKKASSGSDAGPEGENGKL